MGKVLALSKKDDINSARERLVVQFMLAGNVVNVFIFGPMRGVTRIRLTVHWIVTCNICFMMYARFIVQFSKLHIFLRAFGRLPLAPPFGSWKVGDRWPEAGDCWLVTADWWLLACDCWLATGG